MPNLREDLTKPITPPGTRGKAHETSQRRQTPTLLPGLRLLNANHRQPLQPQATQAQPPKMPGLFLHLRRFPETIGTRQNRLRHNPVDEPHLPTHHGYRLVQMPNTRLRVQNASLQQPENARHIQPPTDRMSRILKDFRRTKGFEDTRAHKLWRITLMRLNCC